MLNNEEMKKIIRQGRREHRRNLLLNRSRCRIIGHRWRTKMYGRLCERCHIFDGTKFDPC